MGQETILLIGAHADDDAMSHGTLAMLQAHGNQIYVVTLRLERGHTRPEFVANSACRDPPARGIAALTELGVPGEHYINLGYDDDFLEFEDRKAVVERLVRLIERFGPMCYSHLIGQTLQRWHKSDHRTPRTGRRCGSGRHVRLLSKARLCRRASRST